MEKNVSVFNTALRYGLIGGLILILWTLFTIVSMDRGGVLASSLGLLISIAVTVGISFSVIKFHRDQELSGFISFSKAFVISILAIVIAGAITSAFSVVDLTIINPDYYESAREDMRFQYEDMGMDDEAIEMAMKVMTFIQSPVIMFFMGILSFAFFGAIISLITSLVLKRDEPQVLL